MNTRTRQVGSPRTDEMRSHPTRRPSWRTSGGLLAVGLWASSFLAPVARAAEPGGEIARLQAEIARLAQEQREQRALIFQLMQADQQRYDLLLKFLQSGGAGTPGTPVPPLPSLAPPTPAPAAPTPAPAAENAGAAPTRAGRITGRVQFAGAPVEAYVYLEGLRVPMKTTTVEIHQKNKQFSPRVAVVPLGTRVFFPNDDTILHNVFSPSAEQPFDLGSVKAGDKPGPVVMSKPGPLEIYCNIHAGMQVDVLVVPNPHWARVAPDGTFDLPDVPVGARRLVLWGPGLRSATERVEVTAKGAVVTFAAQGKSGKPHLNKMGQAYGSYGE